MLLRAAATYFATVFAVAFGLGVVRVMAVSPAIGPFAAVAVEVPVILGCSWVVAGRVLRHWPMKTTGRLVMGGLALVMLVVAEAGLAVLFGQSLDRFLRDLSTPVGAVGLAGQIAFGMIPALRGQARG